MPARFVNVPPEPISCEPRQSRTRNLLANSLGDRAAQRRTRFGRDAVGEELLGQANRAEGQRAETLDHALGAERELERAAADVDDHRSPDPHVEMRDGAAEAESRLFVAVEHAHLEPRGARDLGEESARVARFAYGARRHRVDANRAELTRERRHAVERFERGVNRQRRQLAVGARPAARRGAAFISSTTWIDAFGRDVGDDLPNRVRADVDRGDAPMSRRDRSSRSHYREPAEESWTRGAPPDSIASKRRACRGGTLEYIRGAAERFDEFDVRPSTSR